MNDVLGNEGFKAFYKKLSDNYDSSGDFMTYVSDAVSMIAEPLLIGDCELLLNSPSTPFDLMGIHERRTIYKSDKGYDQNGGIRETYVTNDFGIIQVEVYPLPDVKWSDDDNEEIEFLTQVIYDACLRVRLQKLLAQSVLTDPVTGACNTNGIMNAMDEKYKSSKLSEYTAIYFNIKNFGYISNRVGQIESDKVLKDFSFLVREKLDRGEIFGRIGGDNFFLLIESDRADEIIKYIEPRKVMVNFGEKPFEFDVMLRMGIYNVKPVDTPKRVLTACKTAYRFTRNPSGGSKVYFKDDMLESDIKDQEISNRFKKAIKNREFKVYYQPKVDIESSRLIAAEALCRWIRDGEVVPPDEFIPALEREGTISELDFYMLGNVCEDIRSWESRGIEPVKVSVNFSRANILNRKLAEKIIKVIDSYKIDKKYLEVEITETTGYEDFEALSEFVDTMKASGIETSIDDFGTGYSSLNLIKNLNVDIIKIDKSLLENIHGDGSDMDVSDRSMVKNIVNMVNELHMKVVAEGVETNAQMEFLKQINCQVAQGYLFDKPLPKEKFEFRLLGERMYL